jgi:fermentation-respiration switch protein FrsA (DUF1100 family)
MWRIKLWGLARSGLLIYLVVLLVLSLLERSLVFPAMRYPAGEWDAARRYGFEDVWFESADGTKLHGWLAEHPNPRGILLFCHGNGGNVTHRGGVVDLLRTRLDLTIFVFDYRGYGRSEGKPDEPGVMADARAARDWLANRSGVPAEELILLGRSMGGAVATRLATEGGAKALILESTFTSAVDMGASIYPFLPVRLVMQNRFETLIRIGDYQGPLIISHGTADEIIPFEHGRRLFDAATTPDKEFVAIPGGTHNEFPPLSYYDALADFLEGRLKKVNR